MLKMLAFTPQLIEPNNCNYIVHTSDGVCTTVIIIISTSFSPVNTYILAWLGRKFYQANQNNVTTVKD